MGLLDRFLGLFTEVRAREGLTAFLLMLNMFLLLAAYSLLKAIREPLVLTTPGGAEVKSYSGAAIAGLFIILVPLYSALASRVSRVRLINTVTAFFAACLVVFFALNRIGVPIGVPFFIWVGIFSLLIVAQLWAFANDVYSVEEGRRLFVIVGFGASLGAIAGSFATTELVQRLGPYPFMLASCALLIVCMLLTKVIDIRDRRRGWNRGSAPEESGHERHPSTDPIRGRSGFSLVMHDRYLLLIAFFMLLYNFVNTNGEYMLGRTLVDAYKAAHGSAAMEGIDAKKAIGEFYGRYQTAVNVLAAVFQAFLVGRVVRHFGVRIGLLVLPAVAFFGFSGIAFVPVLGLIRTVKIAENSLDYSLQNTVRNALYLPTRRDAKYKAKQANDTFFVRCGDVCSAGLVFAGAHWFGFGTRHFAIVNVALVIVWLALAFVIGRRFHGMSRAARDRE